MSELSNYIVTGASSGIGEAVTNALLETHCNVFGMSRTAGQVQHSNFHHHTLDFSQVNKLENEFKAILKKQTHWDGLICAAGFGQFSAIEQFSFVQMQTVMNVNFLAHALLVKLLLPAMKKRGQGRIIFIGSEAALEGGKNGAMYCASKFALRGFAQSLREECSKSGIHISIINPGMVKTPFFDKLDFKPGEAPENAILAEDVANTVMQVLSMRPGTNIDEINMSPLKHVIDFESR